MKPLPPRPESDFKTTWRELMDQALNRAMAAGNAGESPVGAVLVSKQGRVLARAANACIIRNDPTAHAEILCLRQAAEALGNYRLPDTVLVVTLEPCLMCVGALIQARVSGVVFGARDQKAGALVSNLDGLALPFANHRMWAVEGVMAEECAALLKRFFLARRK
ncbi:MAG: nucleoside deaminase [Desulfovibrionaceae bacterium]|nr:nucleoside deaminase [Desulfovibrionaceae bacterium]